MKTIEANKKADTKQLIIGDVINWAFFPEQKPNYGDEILVEFPPKQMTKKEVLIYGRYTDLMDGCKYVVITPCL